MDENVQKILQAVSMDDFEAVSDIASRVGLPVPNCGGICKRLYAGGLLDRKDEKGIIYYRNRQQALNLESA